MTIKLAFKDEGKAPVKIWTTDVEEGAMEQLRNVASLPFIHHHIAVMPDVHWGQGSTVGSVIPTYPAIIPASVGVDIGCGMTAHKLTLRASDLPDTLSGIRSSLEKVIPHGRTDNGGPNDHGAWGTMPEEVVKTWTWLSEDPRFALLDSKHHHLTRSHKRAGNHLGTLGTGNHFVELCLDKEDNVWLMLHSGSRGIGNAIGR